MNDDTEDFALFWVVGCWFNGTFVRSFLKCDGDERKPTGPAYATHTV